MAAMANVTSCEIEYSVADHPAGTSDTTGAKGRTAGTQNVTVTIDCEADGNAKLLFDEGDACTLIIVEIANGNKHTIPARVEKISPSLALDPDGAPVAYNITFAPNGAASIPTNAGGGDVTGPFSAKNATFAWE